MIKLDFGSGYNPMHDYKTCDIYGYVDYYFDPIEYKIDAEDNTFDVIRCRNVIHHIKDIDKLSKEFKRVLKTNGVLEITEARKEYYSSMRRSMGYWVKIIRIESVKHIYTNPSRLIKTEYEPDDLMIYTNTIDYPDGEFYWFYKGLVSKRNIPNYEPKQKIVRENIITYFEYFINKKEVI